MKGWSRGQGWSSCWPGVVHDLVKVTRLIKVLDCKDCSSHFLLRLILLSEENFNAGDHVVQRIAVVGDEQGITTPPHATTTATSRHDNYYKKHSFALIDAITKHLVKICKHLKGMKCHCLESQSSSSTTTTITSKHRQRMSSSAPIGGTGGSVPKKGEFTTMDLLSQPWHARVGSSVGAC